MHNLTSRALALAALMALVVPGAGLAQTAAPAPAAPATICNLPIPAPAALPPEGSGPVIYQIVPCFEKQGGVSNVEPETYLYYIHLRPSLPSQGRWVPYDEAAEDLVREDFKRLWGTTFLDDLAIVAHDYTFANGVTGKLIVYNMEERDRVRVVDYQGSDEIDRTKIDEQLQERNISLRLDSFVDPGAIARVEGVLRSLMAEKGYTDAVVTHTITPVAGGPKLVNITFNVNEGPKVKIRDVEFVGNTAISDGTLQKRLKENKPRGLFGFITGGGTYRADMYEADADLVLQYLRNRGYVRAQVGSPELRTIEDSADGEERFVQLRIPVTEGPRYRVGEITFEGNTVVRSDGLRQLFEIDPGDWFNEKELRDGLQKAQEVYGRGGYMEFTGAPDYRMRNDGIEEDPAAAAVPEMLLAGGEELNPTVDITMRLQEGEQFFVNRLTFTGNTTTRDNVIRREMRVVEGSIFDTEALKYSVRRLNQLGYFQEIKGDDTDMKVDKTPGRPNAVDVTLKVTEQNRNQLTFGAGVSQYEGFFGQLGFQTSNFLGRGESLTVNMQAGSRAQQYQLAFTEPFLFDRNMTGGFDIYKRSLQYIGYYTQKSTGGNLTFGFPVADFSRMFLNYAYEQVSVADLNEALIDSSCAATNTCSTLTLSSLDQLTETQRQNIARNPFIADSLLIGQGGRRTISKVVPTFLHNTVDNPIFPTRGNRLQMSLDVAGLGGNTNFLKPSIEGVVIKALTPRMSIGGRAQFEYIRPWGSTGACASSEPEVSAGTSRSCLPIFERLVLGGEYSIRGYDIRSVGPTVPESVVVLGGNKSLLFNLEYMIGIAGPVRLILFYDAGQVRDVGQRFALRENLISIEAAPGPNLVDPIASGSLIDPNAAGRVITRVLGRTSAFKTSTGAEIRFFMPVLNVPFRLIFAHNPQRGNVLDNNYQPAKDFVFKFAVGSTF